MFTQISDELLNSYFKININYTNEDLINYFVKNIDIDKFDYQFKSKDLLLRAFTHKSFAHEAKIDLKNNERLEFLGDSVLSLIISEYIFKHYKDVREGDLSKLRSSIVNEETLYEFAKYLNLSKFVLIGKGELLGKGYEKKSILSDCFEAILGAIYLDSDFSTTQKVLLDFIQNFESNNYKVFIEDLDQTKDPKTRLQELIYKKYKVYPKYEAFELKDQNLFKVTLKIEDKDILTITNQSKKNAMALLAKETLAKELF